MKKCINHSLILTILLTTLLQTSLAEIGTIDKSESEGTEIFEQFIKSEIENCGMVEVDIYLMSHCPFAIEAQETILPVLKKYADFIEYKQYYFGYIDENGFVESMHGDEETLENIKQLALLDRCLDDFTDYISSKGKADTEKKSIERFNVDLNDEILMEKYISNISHTLSNGIDNSPTLLINDKVIDNNLLLRVNASCPGEWMSKLTGSYKPAKEQRNNVVNLPPYLVSIEHYATDDRLYVEAKALKMLPYPVPCNIDDAITPIDIGCTKEEGHISARTSGKRKIDKSCKAYTGVWYDEPDETEKFIKFQIKAAATIETTIGVDLGDLSLGFDANKSLEFVNESATYHCKCYCPGDTLREREIKSHKFDKVDCCGNMRYNTVTETQQCCYGVLLDINALCCGEDSNYPGKTLGQDCIGIINGEEFFGKITSDCECECELGNPGELCVNPNNFELGEINNNCDCICYNKGKLCDTTPFDDDDTIDGVYAVNCDCIPKDCLILKANIGDPCKTLFASDDTKRGTVNDDCYCICDSVGESCDVYTYDNDDAKHGSLDTNCNCNCYSVGEPCDLDPDDDNDAKNGFLNDYCLCMCTPGDSCDADPDDGVFKLGILDNDCKCKCYDVGEWCDDKSGYTHTDKIQADCNCKGTPYPGVCVYGNGYLMPHMPCDSDLNDDDDTKDGKLDIHCNCIPNCNVNPNKREANIVTHCGCTDPYATNYNPEANADDESCEYEGCTDSYATNYDSNATIDDGSCEFDYDYYGCTDPTASNYDSSATIDDGSCEFDYDYYGCTDPTAYNYDYYANIDDGSCEYDYYYGHGCTDPTAFNYDSSATTDDGSCEYEGCIDSNATNYDSNATIDDGSCEYDYYYGYSYGCTDPDASNYDSNATTDDGSCTFGSGTTLRYTLPTEGILSLFNNENEGALLNCFPIPTKDFLNIEYQASGGKVNLDLYNTNIKLILNILKSSSIKKGKYTHQLDVSNLPVGIYYVSGTIDNQSVVQKIVIN